MSQHCWNRERKEFSLKFKTNSASSVKELVRFMVLLKLVVHMHKLSEQPHSSSVKNIFYQPKHAIYQLVRKEKEGQLTLSPQ